MSAVKTALLLLLALLCAFHPSPLCEAAVCYVKPTEPHNVTCPGKPCYTLDEYVSEQKKYFDTDNNAILFLNGNHTLSHQLKIHNVFNLTLAPHSERDSVSITPQKDAYGHAIEFISIRRITLKNLASTVFRIGSCTNVTVTGLIAVDVSLINVFGYSTVSSITAVIEQGLAQIFVTYNEERSYSHNISNATLVLSDLGKKVVIRIVGCPPGNLIIENSSLSENIYSLRVMRKCNTLMGFRLTCINTHFYLNVYAMVLETGNLGLAAGEIFLQNVKFFGNSFSIINYDAHSITISDSIFGASDGTAIMAYNTILKLKGRVIFYQNAGFRGGAISLHGLSTLWIPEPNTTRVLFENNTAHDVGGAIYFSSPALSYGMVHWDTAGLSTCQILIDPIPAPGSVVFNFTGNSAINGGDAIYGAGLSKVCISPVDKNNITVLKDKILPISHGLNCGNKTCSLISSDPTGVCMCKNGKPDCSYNPNISVYPGQVFNRSAAVVGDMNGLVSYPVLATHNKSIKLGNELQYIQLSYITHCTNLRYSILANVRQNTEYSIALQASSGKALILTVTVLPCPLGFELKNNSYCGCDSRLPQLITCSITQQVIQRQGNIWIGSDTRDMEKNVSFNGSDTRDMEKSVSFLLSTNCPIHSNCNKTEIGINVSNNSFSNEDDQCLFNHSGVLCGSCRENFSLAIGSNRCLHNCTDKTLSLLIAFAAAGIALVFFIKILNLTVSQGTLNGLIFYANIVEANQFSYFTIVKFSKRLGHPLSLFIAWVNLDFGIETCFYDGMDAYVKAWLQFVFPVYVWTIVVFIIVLSHYSSRASKLFGNNSVPVLATLVLLSYSKLLRAVIKVFSVTWLEVEFTNGSNSTIFLWTGDGTIQYFTGKHIPLFVFALAVLVLLCFPFTLVLISIQWLQKGTHYRVLCWVAKLKPFFDAFTGPLKDKHRYWVGTLLLARCILYAIFFIPTDATATTSATFSLSVILVFLASFGFKYKSTLLSVLELSYIVNIGILSAGSLIVKVVDGSEVVLVDISSAIVFVQFIATVAYHVLHVAKLRGPLGKLGSRLRQCCCRDAGCRNTAEERQAFVESAGFYHDVGAYREPVLEYLDSNR